MDPVKAIDKRAHGTGGSTPAGARVAGVTLTLALACGLLFGCASVQSAGDGFVGWLHSSDEPPPAQAAPPAAKTAKKKPAAAAAPVATPNSVATDNAVEAPEPEAGDPSPPAGESQAPESVFDPY